MPKTKRTELGPLEEEEESAEKKHVPSSDIVTYVPVLLSELLIGEDENSRKRGTFYQVCVDSSLSLPLACSFTFTNARTPQFLVKKSDMTLTITIGILHSKDKAASWKFLLGKFLDIQIQPPLEFETNGGYDVCVEADGTPTPDSLKKLAAQIKTEFQERFIASHETTTDDN